MSDLDYCPYCGSFRAAVEFPDGGRLQYAQCGNCGARGAPAHTYLGAVQNWNRRSGPLTSSPVVMSVFANSALALCEHLYRSHLEEKPVKQMHLGTVHLYPPGTFVPQPSEDSELRVCERCFEQLQERCRTDPA